MPCRLTLFGPPRLLDDQGKLIPVPAKVYALVAYLLLTSGGAPSSRAILRQFLWEDAEPKTAAANLRKFLQRLREQQERCGFKLIEFERTHVHLSPSADVDLTDFLRIVSKHAEGDIGSLCELYRGDLLDGLDLDDIEALDWLQVQRGKLRETFITAVATRLEGKDGNADSVSVRSAARRLVEVDPYNEAGHRALMRLFALEGETARVRETYLNLQRRLRAELEVEPDPSTTDLYQALIPSWSESAVTPSQPAALPARLPAQPTLEVSAAAMARASLAANRSGIPRLAILPPAPFSRQDLSYQLAGSLIEDITIGLCRFKSLAIVAPHTAREFSAGGKKEILGSFGVDYSVETQLGDRAGRSSLSVKLLEASSRRILWTDQYELNPTQTVQSYRNLSVQILTTLVNRIERTELARYDAEQNPSAYHLFLSGQRHLHTLDLPNIRRARRAFRFALAGDQEFVPALSGLAMTLRLEWLLLARGETDLLSEATRLAEQSIKIDPDDARGFRELGISKAYLGRFDEGLEALAQGEHCYPQYADLLSDYADALLHACESKTALQKITRAIELNPLCPDTYWWAAGGANFQLERYADAIDCLSRMREQSPAYRLLAASWAMLGDREQARDFVVKTRESLPDFNVSQFFSVVPFRDPTIVKAYEHGLREAGFD